MAQTVFITGGSRGIGAECVRAFAAAGWQVAFTYRVGREMAGALAEQTGALALCAMLFGLIGTNLVLKNLVQRVRPYEMVEGLTHLGRITDPNSFPSGHTTAAFAAGVVWFRTLPARWARVLALASAFLMAFSRLYVGVHYPTDVLAGAVMGTVCALLALWLGKRWKVLNRLGE